MNLGHRFLVLLLFFAITSWPPAAAAKDNKQQEAEALLAKARELSDIRCDGCPPFKLRALIRYTFPEQAPQAGEYLLLWRNRQNWSEHINLSGFDRIRVREGETVWRMGTSEYDPFLIDHTALMMGRRTELTVESSEEASKIHEHAERGMTVSCLEVRPRVGSGRRLCFDPDRGFLLRTEYSGLFSDRSVFSDYRPASGKFYPRLFTESQKGTTVATATVEEWKEASEEELRLVVRPSGSAPEPKCDGPGSEPAKLLSHPLPPYPTSARTRGIMGKITVYAVVGRDGRLHNLTVLKSPDRELSKAALATAEEWRYQPATCAGQPVPVVTTIDVSFQ